MAAVETEDGILDGDGGAERDIEAREAGVEIIRDETLLGATEDWGTDGTELDS
jgi:hypothetical protein